MSSRTIAEILAPLYRGFLPEFFQKPLPPERAANCQHCAMWERPGSNSSAGHYFSRETKCCTHHPVLPNYLVGALLCDPDGAYAQGRQRIQEAVKKRAAVTPQGVQRPKRFELLIKSSPAAFGKSSFLLCPFYEQTAGNCTIWPFWDGVCATWFCKHDSGEDGRQFWRSLRKYLVAVEDMLSQYALREMGWDAQRILAAHPEPQPLTCEELDVRAPSEESYNKLWGAWAGREEEFFVATYRLVASLSPDLFARISGITLEIKLENVKGRYEQMVAPKLPQRLKRNPALVVEKTQGGRYILTGYSPFDPVEVSQRLYGILDFFDGRQTTADVCRCMKESSGKEIAPNLLRTLYQFRVLIDGEGS